MRFFSVVDAYNWSFKTVFKNLGIFFPASLIYFLATNGKSLVALVMCGKFEGDWWQFFINFSTCQRDLGLPLGVLGVVLLVVGIWLFFGLVRIAFDFYDHGSSELSRLFSQGDLLLRGLLLSVIYGLFIGLGLVALIIPGIYLICRYAFVFPAYVDNKGYIQQTLSYSSVLTQGNRWKVLGFLLLGGFIAIIPVVGAVLFVLATVHAYRSLQQDFEDGVIVESVAEASEDVF